MIRRVFFSFDYDRDFQKVSHIRDCWVINPDRQTAGFIDAYSYEQITWKGKDAILKWIDREMEGASVTAVLIGSGTGSNEYIEYAIRKSHALRKGLFGIHIHNMKDGEGNTGEKGINPLEKFCIEKKGNMANLSELYPVYDWVNGNGYSNLADWVETAARKAGR